MQWAPSQERCAGLQYCMVTFTSPVPCPGGGEDHHKTGHIARDLRFKLINCFFLELVIKCFGTMGI